jgi:hypothetical protein
LTRPWAEIRELAGLPEVIPYSLRHSSIVRGIRQGLPIRLVAALHDTSVQMIEKHYARWIADGLEELAARSVVPLVPPPDEGKVAASTSAEFAALLRGEYEKYRAIGASSGLQAK